MDAAEIKSTIDNYMASKEYHDLMLYDSYYATKKP